MSPGQSSTDEDVPGGSGRWPNITALIARSGHITIGHIAPIENVAVAAQQRRMLATLLRRPDESVEALMQRLDHAVGEALDHGVHINEIKGGHFLIAGPDPAE